MVASSDPLWFLLVGPASVGVAIAAIWFAMKPDRVRKAERDSRMLSAMFGYEEGATKVPGIYQVVVGDGDGSSLSAIAQEARDTAVSISAKQDAVAVEFEAHQADELHVQHEGAQAIATLTGKVTAHIAEDAQRWDEITQWQQVAVQTASEVKETAKAVARDVAELAVNTAEAVAYTAAETAEALRLETAHTAEAVASTAVDTASGVRDVAESTAVDVAQKAVDTASALHDESVAVSESGEGSATRVRNE